jgi:hypothetical protein
MFFQKFDKKNNNLIYAKMVKVLRYRMTWKRVCSLWIMLDKAHYEGNSQNVGLNSTTTTS